MALSTLLKRVLSTSVHFCKKCIRKEMVNSGASKYVSHRAKSGSDKERSDAELKQLAQWLDC